jgi:hypothetical protein
LTTIYCIAKMLLQLIGNSESFDRNTSSMESVDGIYFGKVLGVISFLIQIHKYIRYSCGRALYPSAG